jgi:hypothetical protein
VVAAGKALLEIAQKDPGRDWSSDAAVQRAKEQLTRKAQEIAERRGQAELAEELRAELAIDDGPSALHRGGTTLADVIKLSLMQRARLDVDRAAAPMGRRRSEVACCRWFLEGSA